MRLLDKNEVNNQKNLDRKREIEEGIKLAKKVELLRETLAKEESNFQKYREASLSQLRLDIEELTSIKDLLINEIEILEGTVKDLRKKVNGILKDNIKNT